MTPKHQPTLVPLLTGSTKKGKPTGQYARVSPEDFDLVMRWRWTLTKNGYPRGANNVLHRFVLGVKTGDGVAVDHINGDKLDNRRENLRVCSYAENAQNRRGGWGKTSKYRGVKRTLAALDSPHGGKPWQAQVGKGGKSFYLGSFATEEEAGEAAAAWRRENMPFSEVDHRTTHGRTLDRPARADHRLWICFRRLHVSSLEQSRCHECPVVDGAWVGMEPWVPER